MRTTSVFYTISLALCLSSLALADSIDDAIHAIHQVQVEGEGSTSARKAWKTLAEAEPSQLPKILAGMKDTDPVVANWIASAADFVFQKVKKGSDTFCAKHPPGRSGKRCLTPFLLEQFILDPTQSGQGRTLAYDQLCRIEPAYRERLLPKLLGDPWPDLCQKAVQYAIEQAETLEKSDADKTEVIAAYQKILDDARDWDQIRDLARRLDKLGQKVDLAAQLGFIIDWHVVGPFDSSGGAGLARAFEPEKQEGFTFEETYQGKPAPDNKDKADDEAKDAKSKEPRTLRWVNHHTTHSDGRVDLNKVLCEEKEVTAYAVTDFISKADQDVELRISSRNALQVWVNGQQVAFLDFYHAGGQFDLYRVKAKFHKGRNTIFLKIRQNEQTQSWAKSWEFAIRVCDPIGRAIVSEDRE